ncbi:MAG: ABC transporter transmembrane domain-containing protein [Pseudomonadota bacterium]
MGEINAVRAALERLRGADFVNKQRDDARTAVKGEAGASSLARAQESAGDDNSHGLISTVLGSLVRFRSVLRELSPDGLAARGIPATQALKMPRSVIFASIIINVFGLALPLAILQVYDRIIPNQANETFALLMFGLLTIVVAEGSMRIARSYVVSWAATRFTAAITQDLIGRFLHAPHRHFAGVSAAKLIEKLSNIGRIGEFYGGQSRLMFIDLPFAVVFLVMMGLIGGWLVVVPFMILCLFGFATIASSRYYKQVLEKKEEHEARTYDFVAEALSGILTMKSHAAESLMMRRFERLQSTNAQLQYSMITTAMQGQSIAGLLGNGTMIAMVTIGAYLAVQGQMTVGVLACCSLLSGRAVQPILRVASTWNEYQRASLSVDEVAELFKLDAVPPTTAIQADPPTPEVCAKDLTLTFGSSERSLTDLSFTIESGSIIAIAGADGSGKSTLLNAIAGLVVPAEGAITLDGVEAHEFRRIYQSAVGIFNSSTEVFAGTIFENLSLFGQGGSAEDIRWATEAIGVDTEIDRLSEGYDTLLGQGIAEALPAGFMARILLARVLAQKPVVWVLDDPQDVLDPHGQAAFLKAIDNLRGWITIVFTTKNETFMRQADQIMHVHDGEVDIHDTIDSFNRALKARDFDGLEIETDEDLILGLAQDVARNFGAGEAKSA